MPTVETIIAGFLVLTVAVSIVSRRIHIPYTVMLVVLGIALASLSASSIFGVNLIFNNLVGGGGYFVALILPPLLFEAMMNIRSSELRSVINPALTLATLGVVISTLVAGLALWTLAGIPLSTAFLFGALIAPTDTATVLEIFRRVKVPAKLSALLETEAGLNDATGIVVFSVVLASVTVSRPSPIAATAQFALLLGGGAVVGLLVGFGSEVLSSLVDDSLSETIITVICVYGSYSLATYLGVSGLIAVTVAGLYFGNLTMQTTLVQKARGTVKSFWEIVAFVANSVAFLFIGLSTDVAQLVAGALAIGVAFLAVNLARAASVYPILGIFSAVKSKIPTSWRNVAMLGGMKGALSIVLLASIPSSIEGRDTITTMVLGVAFLSITLQGSLLFRYADSRFHGSQKSAKKEAEAKWSATLAELEELRRLKEAGSIPQDEFAFRMAQREKELAQLVEEMKVTNQTAKLLRSRWKGLVSLFKRRGNKRTTTPAP
jgi:CPA1 family monovalent cation:H+ antiporter